MTYTEGGKLIEDPDETLTLSMQSVTRAILFGTANCYQRYKSECDRCFFQHLNWHCSSFRRPAMMASFPLVTRRSKALSPRLCSLLR